MTNQTPESVIAEVIEYHADTIGTHYEGCYKHHAGCLAVRLRDMLREPGDAATAALERVRVIHVRDTPSIGGDWCLDDHHKWPCPTVAALDGAPEPEVKP